MARKQPAAAGKLPTKQGAAAAPVSPPAWVKDWLPAYQVDRPRTEVEAERDRWAELSRPADPKAAAVLLDQTLELFVPLPQNWAQIAGFYHEVLADVPLDLVEAALLHVRRTCTFFPKPAEIRGPIAEQLTERRRTRDRLETMLALGRFEESAGG